MTKVLGVTLILLGAAGAALGTPVPAPEIDAGAGASALALLSGALLVLRSRRRK
jgi:hypothetical protein